jgi:hypothetical protein
MHWLLPFFVIAIFASAIPLSAEGPTPTAGSPLVSDSEEQGTGKQIVRLEHWPANNQFQLPAPFKNVSRAYFLKDAARTPHLFELQPNASAVTYFLPKAKPSFGNDIVLETVEKTEQFANGRIAFSALDSEVLGPDEAKPTAKLETMPGTHRIGFWTKEKDFVRWQYTATRPGMYGVELTYAVAGGDGTEIEIKVGEKPLTCKLTTTGSYYRYTVLDAGNVYIPAAGKLPITVRCLKKTGGAVMNLKAVTLRPTCEGTPPKADDGGVITCHARDVTIHGMKVQYEPKPEKNTVGFWVNKEDTVSWNFDVAKAGKYEVEILQGCGKGQGGSKVLMTIDNKDLEFTVEDTGHFQNFKPRVLGEVELQAGAQTLRVIPVTKAAAAVMDLRQVVLRPKN